MKNKILIRISSTKSPKSTNTCAQDLTSKIKGLLKILANIKPQNEKNLRRTNKINLNIFLN